MSLTTIIMLGMVVVIWFQAWIIRSMSKSIKMHKYMFYGMKGLFSEHLPRMHQDLMMRDLSAFKADSAELMHKIDTLDPDDASKKL